MNWLRYFRQKQVPLRTTVLWSHCEKVACAVPFGNSAIWWGPGVSCPMHFLGVSTSTGLTDIQEHKQTDKTSTLFDLFGGFRRQTNTKIFLQGPNQLMSGCQQNANRIHRKHLATKSNPIFVGRKRKSDHATLRFEISLMDQVSRRLIYENHGKINAAHGKPGSWKTDAGKDL